MSELRNHWWWRPGWRAGRFIYSWHFVFPDDDTLARHTRPYQEALKDLAGLDIVPAPWLHMTTQDVGFADEVSDAEHAALVAATRERLGRLEPFDATLGAPVVWGEAIVLLPSPVEPFEVVRRELRAAIVDVLGPERLLGKADRYTPHSSIAYVSAPGPSEPVDRALARVGAASPRRSTLHVTRASLLHQERVDHLYRWDALQAADLGGRTGG